MAKIQLEGVSKRYGTFTALKDVTLTVDTASFTSVFGPPGSGKSVFLRILLGLEPVDDGRILIDGKDVTRAAPNERNMAMVFQNLALFPHLTSRQNIAFPLRRRQVAEGEINRRIDQLTSVLSIGHILHKKPAALSGGERQRVAIARALVRDASAYLMDEPIAALDARLRDDMRVELKRLQSELGKTFIYVTHDCEEAMSVADSMAILEAGKVIQFDRPDGIYAKPATQYVAELVGAPKINLLNGRRQKNEVHVAFGRFALGDHRAGSQVPDGEVCIAIRPESVTLQSPVADSQQGGKVTDIERLGAFAIVTLGERDSHLRAIVPGDAQYTVGSTVGVSVAPENILLFNTQTGNRIC